MWKRSTRPTNTNMHQGKKNTHTRVSTESYWLAVMGQSHKPCAAVRERVSIAAEESMYLQWTDLHLQIRFQQRWMMGGSVSVCLRACACVYLCFWWVAGVTTRVVGGWGSGLSWEITPVLRSRGGYRRQVVFLGGPLNLFLKSHRITQTEIEPAD